MSTARQNPQGQDREGAPRAEPGAAAGKPEADGGLWLDGGVLACACPDCGSPMSIRLWLLVADCFCCGASIELTPEQEKQALRLLRRHEQARRAESEAAGAAISPTMVPTVPSRPASRSAPGPAATQRPKAPRSTSRPPRPPRRGSGLGGALGRLTQHLPAWLVSLVFHVVALLLLSLWYAASPLEPPSITLSTALGYEDSEGADIPLENLADAFEFETLGPQEYETFVNEPGAANEDLLEPRIVELPAGVPQEFGPTADWPANDSLVEPVTPTGQMFAGRDVRLRAELVSQAGGTAETEAAVAKGLKFLVRHQGYDGHWSLSHFAATPDCDETCVGAGTIEADVAATAMGLLPLLGAGQTHQRGEYRENVRKGLDWLLQQQESNGRLMGSGNMYSHGQATIVLCEAYGMSQDKGLRRPAQSALDFIVRAQHYAGGWRYNPGQAGDTSVLGWQIMALKSGQMAGLRVPKRVFDGAVDFLDQVQGDPYGATYAYQRNQRPTPAMSAEALLCRQYLGWPRDHSGLSAGVNHLLESLPDPSLPNVYYWYYATQVMHHFGGKPWETWNARMSNALVATQETRGHAAGSWAPRGNGADGGYASQAGRIYMTALAICTLEVYYRHMPIYREDAVRGVP